MFNILWFEISSLQVEQIQNDANGGSQTIIWNYFLHVNNFRHVNIHVNKDSRICSLVNSLVNPFFIFAGAYLF